MTKIGGNISKMISNISKISIKQNVMREKYITDNGYKHKDNIHDGALIVNDEDCDDADDVDETVKTEFMKPFQDENYTQTNH